MNKTVFQILAACLFMSCSTGTDQAYEGPDRIGVVISDDFETNELYGWESYPYAQDIGFDPTLLCQKEPTYNGSNYAIARIVKPNDAVDLSEGFTKQIDMWTTGDTRLKLAYHLIADRKPEKIDFMLGLFDGRLFTHTVQMPDVNRWNYIDIPAESFTLDGEALAEGEHMQVIAVKAFYPLVTHYMSYTISLDNVSLNGARQRQFIAERPSSTFFEHYGISILNEHVFYGDDLSLSVKPEGGSLLESVIADIVAPSGETIASDINFKKTKDGIWSNDSIYRFKSGDPRGQWTINLVGSTVSNDVVKWGFRVLMPGERLSGAEHPRLFFDARELQHKLQNQLPGAIKILEKALPDKITYTDEYIDSINEGTDINTESITGNPYNHVDDDYGRWRNPMSRLGSVISSCAWKYMIDGDEEAGRFGVKALLRLCSFQVWNNPWMEAHGRHIYYPVGYTCMPVAVGYDYLYHLMSEEERAFVREAIMDKAIRHFYRDMVEMNRMPSNLSNHIAVVTAGVGLAATAIYGDDPANPSLEPYLSGIMTKMKAFIDNTYMPGGSYGEPFSYHAMASRDLCETMEAFERNFGVDFTTTTHFKDMIWYPLYATTSTGFHQYLGDSGHWYSLSEAHYQWLVKRLRDPWAYAWVKPYWESGNGGYSGWLWYTEGIEPQYREQLPTSRLFAEKGNMIMRSGWSDKASVFNFKAGPNSNHYHLDQGQIMLMTNSEILLSDAGHSSSYYGNLYYPCYYTQPIGHNVMLVDHIAESQSIADYENGVASLRNYPSITHHLAGDISDEVEGDLTCAYKDKLVSYTRSIVYMKPDIIFLLDRVKGNGGHEYDWLFHAEHTNGKNSIEHDEDTGRISITRTKARLDMDVLAPDIISANIRDSDRDESFITLKSNQGIEETTFLAVLNPSADTKESNMQSSLIEGDNFIGAIVKHDLSTDIVLFTRGGESGRMEAESLETEAERCAVRLDSNSIVEKAIIRGTKLAVGGKVLISSDRQVIAAVDFGRHTIALDVAVSDDSAASFNIAVSKRPSSVMFDGIEKGRWNFSDGTVIVSVPTGRSSVKILR